MATRKHMEPGQWQILRERLGMTQEEFAHLLGVTTSTVSRWECGRNVPSKAMVKLAKMVIKEQEYRLDSEFKKIFVQQLD